MEVDDDLDNIFEENENETENKASTTESSSAVRVPPSKRIIKNPRLKFNPERLCGERGIPVLVDHFRNVKFKGKGYEKEDLDKLLINLEHWTHRLYPSMKFIDCLHQIEKLGKKRPVQTCLRKIRLDMPILNSDFVKGDEDDDVQRNDDFHPEPLPADAFDSLIQNDQNVLNRDDSSSINVEIDSTYSSPMFHTNQGQALGSSGSNLTEVQKNRMERNRLLAAERRKAKLKEIDPSPSESPIINSTTSQGISDTFASLLAPTKSTFNEDNILDKTVISDNLIEKSTSPPLDDGDSENLALDDLIDLVDENESIPVKNVEIANDSIHINDELNENSHDITVPSNTNLFASINVDTSGDVLNNDAIGLSKMSEITNTEYTNFNSIDIVDKNVFTSDKIRESTRQNTDVFDNSNEENENCLEDTLPIRFSNSNIDISEDIPCSKKVESNETKVNFKSLRQETLADIINNSDSKDLKQNSSDSCIGSSGKINEVLNCSEITMCDNDIINSIKNVENENSTCMPLDN